MCVHSPSFQVFKKQWNKIFSDMQHQKHTTTCAHAGTIKYNLLAFLLLKLILICDTDIRANKPLIQSYILPAQAPSCEISSSSFSYASSVTNPPTQYHKMPAKPLFSKQDDIIAKIPTWVETGRYMLWLKEHPGQWVWSAIDVQVGGWVGELLASIDSTQQLWSLTVSLQVSNSILHTHDSLHYSWTTSHLSILFGSFFHCIII